MRGSPADADRSARAGSAVGRVSWRAGIPEIAETLTEKNLLQGFFEGDDGASLLSI